MLHINVVDGVVVLTFKNEELKIRVGNLYLPDVMKILKFLVAYLSYSYPN